MARKQGSDQYDDAFRAQLVALVIDQKMPISGVSKLESFWSRMKHELRHDMLLDDHRQARLTVYRWVHQFYNQKRMHSALNNMTPVDFEEQPLHKHSDRAHCQ